jgi:hypothetical protein
LRISPEVRDAKDYHSVYAKIVQMLGAFWRTYPTTQTRLRPSNSQYYHVFESLPTAREGHIFNIYGVEFR